MLFRFWCCLVLLLGIVQNHSLNRIIRSASTVEELGLEFLQHKFEQGSYSIQFEQKSGRVLLVENLINLDDISVIHKNNIAYRGLLQTDTNSNAQTSSGAFLGRVQNDSSSMISSYGREVSRNASSNEFMESIVGRDEREKVVDVMEYPYRAIGRVLFNCGGKTQACTGTLIGPNLVVTSAHCIYSRVHGRCSDFSFGAAQQGKWAPFGEVGVRRALTQPQWLINFPRTYDYGILELDQEVGYLIGWMSYGYDCGDFDQDLYTAGYPNDLDSASTTMYQDACLGTYLDACPCEKYNPYVCPESVQYASTFKHTCDTFLGQSGAPLWAYIGDNKFPQVRGFHAAGFTGTSFDQRNTGVFVGQQMYSFFQKAAQK